MTILERLFDKTIPEPNSGCLLWLGATTSQGYGRFWNGTRTVLPHRYVYECSIGRQLSREEEVLHKCDNPYCVNIDHLFLGNNTINYLDKMAKGRQAVGSMINRSTLTEDDVRRMRELHSQGISQKDLSILYGVSTGRVSDIINRRQWRYC